MAFAKDQDLFNDQDLANPYSFNNEESSAFSQSSQANTSDDEWYDQGFDLGDDDHTSYEESFGINTSLLNSTAAQLKSSLTVQSDAKENEHKHTSSNSSQQQTNAIMVGGNGKFVRQSSTNLYVGGDAKQGLGGYSAGGDGSRLAYTSNTNAQGQVPTADRSEVQELSEYDVGSNDDDYSTYVDRSKRSPQTLSFRDAKFRKSISAQEQNSYEQWEQNSVARTRAMQQKEAMQRKALKQQEKEREQAKLRQQRQQRFLEQQKAQEQANLAAQEKRAQLQAQRNMQIASQTQRQQSAKQSKYEMYQQAQQARASKANLQDRIQQAQALMNDASHLRRNKASTEIVNSAQYEKEQALRNSADTGPYGSQAYGPQSCSVDLSNTKRSGPKHNSEKSLEELAAEYPNMAPENLVKLKRSGNRCHLVSRTPVFDANSNIVMSELKFTSGKVFQVNALKSPHVFHVLFGYFIRRGLSCFIGRTKRALVMMPLTYDFLDYIDSYSVSRIVLRICPEQPVTPSALHILTKLRRAGMSFAIDIMSLVKKDWNKAVLSIEYVMIDLSQKVSEQLNLFEKIKAKAPWLKTIGHNDPTGEGYVYLMHNQIDLYNGVYWTADIKFVQDTDFFKAAQQQFVSLVKELFKSNVNYTHFLRFLRNNENITQDTAVFLYRFRQASPRQVQNVEELYQYILQYGANRCFSVIIARAIMLTYVKAADVNSKQILQEHYIQALIRGYFVEYMSKILNDAFVRKYAFSAGIFSLLHYFLLEDEMDVIANDDYAEIFDRIYGESELLADIIDCVIAIENTDLTNIFNFIQKHRIPPASVLVSYEKALMRTNEILLVLNIVAARK